MQKIGIIISTLGQISINSTCSVELSKKVSNNTERKTLQKNSVIKPKKSLHELKNCLFLNQMVYECDKFVGLCMQYRCYIVMYDSAGQAKARLWRTSWINRHMTFMTHTHEQLTCGPSQVRPKKIIHICAHF